MSNRNRSLPAVWRESSLKPIWKLQQSLDRLMDEFATPFEFIPACDLEETDSHYLLSFDLPGISKDEIHVEMKGDRLVISGERKEDHEKKDASAISTERHYGSFYREITLPEDVDPEKVEAAYEAGVLHVSVPKIESVKAKPIEIKEGKAGFMGKLLGQKKTGKAA